MVMAVSVVTATPFKLNQLLRPLQGFGGGIWSLDGRNRTIVIAESLASVIAAIRITSVRWRHIPSQNKEIGPRRPCVRCAAIRIARCGVHSCNIRSTWNLRNGLRELIAFAELKRLAIGDFAHLRSGGGDPTGKNRELPLEVALGKGKA